MMDSDRMEVARLNATLKEKLLRHMPAPGISSTAIDGLMLARREAVNGSGCALGQPTAAIIVQGSKKTLFGSQEYQYGENQCLVVGMDMPSSFQVVDPTPEKPFLSIFILLNRQLITQLVTEMACTTPPDDGPCRGVGLAAAEPELLDAFLRLLTLLEKPEQIAVRAPIIMREIHYLLLVSPQGANLRRLNTFGTHSNQIVQAVGWLRGNFTEALRVESLARQVRMATSTFHRCFKEVTGLSPLQFHKQLRLHEAQRLMLAESRDASNAAYAVGYESPTQFIREYKRLFGEPPHRDINRRRDNIAAGG